MKRKKTEMKYDTTEELFTHMDNLETYSKMHSIEISKDEPSWESVDWYSDNIKKARKSIYELVKGNSND
jgi:hypothetical protein|tara:strand:+ start:1192 stop:1398 length:207 start_codon:yes stop_codon:yes gene_type:complete